MKKLKYNRVVCVLKLFLLMIVLSLFSACGDSQKVPVAKSIKNSKRQVVKVENNNRKDDTEVLSATDFSNAFERKKYKAEPVKTVKKVEKLELHFKIDALGGALFNNDDFKDTVAPSSSIAAKFINPKNYSWAPKWRYVGKGGVLIPDAKISKDRSLIALLETITDETSSKKSSLIVLIDCYSWKVVKIHVYKNKYFTKIFFTKNGNKLLVWEEGEKSFSSIQKINVISGAIEEKSKDIKDQLLSLTISENHKKLYLKTANKKKSYYIFNINSLDRKPKKAECDSDDSYVFANNNSIITFSKNKIAGFRPASKQLMLEIKNPIEAVPDVAIFAGEKGMVYSSYMKPAAVTIGTKCKIISKSSGRVLFYRSDINLLAFEEYKNRQITFMDLSDFSVKATLIPERIKPKTKAAALLLAYLPNIKKYMILDRNGTLALYNKPGKKWRKLIIFAPIK